jgi:hypothetical protein
MVAKKKKKASVKEKVCSCAPGDPLTPDVYWRYVLFVNSLCGARWVWEEVTMA